MTEPVHAMATGWPGGSRSSRARREHKAWMAVARMAAPRREMICVTLRTKDMSVNVGGD